MKAERTSSVEELQVISRFEGLRAILTSDPYADHLDKPLAFWAMPSDRRLPLALLGRPLGDLLNTPFAELSRTPGIGQRKINSFVKLLARAANTDPSELPVELVKVSSEGSAAGPTGAAANGNGFSPAAVSEVMWSQWRATVVQHGLQSETLGRWAPSLQSMTRVIWSTPLGEYVDCTLEEIRAMKTHGEKRVNAILEVFYSTHVVAAGMGTMPHLTVRIVPRLIDKVEQWIGRTLQQPGVPGKQELFENFVSPLLEQIRVDATQQIASLAENRLGICGPVTSVRQAARNMGLTRARVYQLLNEINDIMTVRWPNGRHQVYELRERIQTELTQAGETDDLKQFFTAIELFYPGNRRGAAGPLERVPVMIASGEAVREVEFSV
jgi:hypothetical protein